MHKARTWLKRTYAARLLQAVWRQSVERDRFIVAKDGMTLLQVHTPYPTAAPPKCACVLRQRQAAWACCACEACARLPGRGRVHSSVPRGGGLGTSHRGVNCLCLGLHRLLCEVGLGVGLSGSCTTRLRQSRPRTACTRSEKRCAALSSLSSRVLGGMDAVISSRHPVSGRLGLTLTPMCVFLSVRERTRS